MSTKKKKKVPRQAQPPKVTGALKKAAAAFENARVQRNAAREALAHYSKLGDPHHIVDASAAWMVTALRRLRKRLLGIDGVVGIGLGSKVRNGIPTDEPCISIFVHQKIPLEQLREQGSREIPKATRVGKRKLVIDVVELGGLKRQLSLGDDIGPSGVSSKGTLGVFARDTDDNASVAVTAMHVCGLMGDIPGGNVTSIPFCMPSAFNGNGGAVFGDLVRGTVARIDAAKLRLHGAQAPGGIVPGIGPVAGWRPLTFPGDLQTTVFMFGAVSGLQQGFIANTAIDLPADDLESAVLVNIHSTDGDSGAAIVDSQRFVLGFLVGAGDAQLGNHRVFCPAGLVFSVLGCDIP